MRLELPLPKWAVVVIAILALAGGGAAWWLTHDSTRQLVTLKQANDALASQVDEFYRHIGQAPESSASLFADVRGRLDVSGFTDGCVLIQRSTPKGPMSKLVLDLTREPQHTAVVLPSITAVLEAAQWCEGRCLEQHPGPFQAAYGARSGCWIDYWRYYDDGCTSVVPIDSCNGVFGDARWTCCRH